MECGSIEPAAAGPAAPAAAVVARRVFGRAHLVAVARCELAAAVSPARNVGNIGWVAAAHCVRHVQQQEHRAD